MSGPDMRVTIASAVVVALQEAFPAVKDSVSKSLNTSGCPVIKFTVGDQTYHLTLTRARS